MIAAATRKLLTFLCLFLLAQSTFSQSKSKSIFKKSHYQEADFEDLRPMGILQNLDSRSYYDDRVVEQIQHEVETKGVGNLEQLLLGASYWEI